MRFERRPSARVGPVFSDRATPRGVFVPDRMRGARSDHHFLPRTKDPLLSTGAAVERPFQNLDALVFGHVNVILGRRRNRPADVLELKECVQRLVCRHHYDDSISTHVML
jgi:hypothetical protein